MTVAAEVLCHTKVNVLSFCVSALFLLCQNNDSDSNKRQCHQGENYNRRFTSVPKVKVGIAEEFEDSVPSKFSVGYFDLGPATKR